MRAARLTAAVGSVALLGALALAACSSGPDDAAPATTGLGRRTTTTAAGGAAAPPSTARVTTTTSAPFDLRRADLSAGPYRVRCPGGEVELRPSAPAPGVDDRPVVLDPLAPQFVDLTGDGRPEVVAEASCRVVDDPEAAVRSVVVLGAEAGSVVQMGQPLEGADPTVVGASLAVGRSSSPAPDAGADTGVDTGVDADVDGPAGTVIYEPFAFDGAAWVAGADGAPVLASDPLTVDGLGSLVVGAPFGEVAIATGRPVEVAPRSGGDGSCVDVVLPGGPGGVRGMGGGGVVHAVRVEDPAVRTDDGLGVGSAAADVARTYPDQVSVRPTAGSPGEQLVVAFPDLPDRVLRFDTDGAVVTAIVAGEVGWADGTAGCG